MQTSPRHYEFSFTEAPFCFTLAQAEQQCVRVNTALTVASATWEEAGGVLRLTFVESTARLTLAFAASQVTVRWEGAGIVNQIPLEGHWYGMGELIHQRWPLNQVMLQQTDFITMDNGPTGLLCILTPAWLASTGVLVLAHSPLAVGLNQPPASAPRYVWDFGAQQGPAEQRPARDPGGEGDGLLTLTGDDLHYTLTVTADLPAAHAALVEQVGHPPQTPPARLFTLPTWTTWARYKDRIDQKTVLRFAREIVAHEYPHGVLEIDDRWQTQYGDLTFDSQRFPDPAGMIAQLHALGFQVTAWTMPFLHPDSEAAREGAAAGYLVRRPDGAPYLINWWQGQGYLLDATNPEALAWFGERLRALQAATGLDGYKFDAGEACFLPEDAVTHTPLPHRNDFTHRYVVWIGANFSLCEVRSGWFNQRAPIFSRLWDETSTWSHANGLRSIIPSALSLSLTGYPFILPDMVGGNAYFTLPERGLWRWLIARVIQPWSARRASADGGAFGTGGLQLPRWIEQSPRFGYPTAELLIRWTQVNALLPAMQFSLAPWNFGKRCASLCRKYARLHETFAPRILALAQAAVETGAPLIRPLFWLAPHDERALLCDDAFLLGDDLLVAPVVHEGQRTRDIYFPPGTWRDYWTGDTITGPTLLAAYPAPLETLPLFERVAPMRK